MIAASVARDSVPGTIEVPIFEIAVIMWMEIIMLPSRSPVSAPRTLDGQRGG